MVFYSLRKDSRSHCTYTHTFAGNAQATVSGTAAACPHAAQWQRRYCWEACTAQRGTQLSMGYPHMMLTEMGVVDAGGCTTLWGNSNGPLRSTQWAGLTSAEPGWHPHGYRRNFPLGKTASIFALIRLQRNAKGAREMKHILSQPNGQINTGKKKLEPLIKWTQTKTPDLKWELKGS